MSFTTSSQPSAARQAAARSGDAAPSAWYALAVLTVVTLLAFVDRGVLVLQAEQIRKSMDLSDFQVGLMQGTGVAIFAGLASYPLGWLADRFDRRLVLAGCVLLWSAAVLASGLAQSYPMLLLSTALVGAGEAGLVPIVYAMIPELFGESKRQTANSVYALASQATGALALALCGWVVGWVEAVRPLLGAELQLLDGWRLSFFAVVLPTPLMMLALFTIRLRRRMPKRAEPATTGGRRPPSAEVRVTPYLRRHWQALSCFFGGVGMTIFGFNAVGSWLAVIYARVFGQTPQQLGAVLGTMVLVATATGFVLSVYGMRFLSRRAGMRANIRALWISVATAVLCFAMMLLATSAHQMYAIQGLYIFLMTTAVMVYPTALQSLAPDALRARLVALMSVLSAGLVAIAPPIVGLVSDHFFQQRPNGLLIAAVTVAIPALLLGMALLIRCERLYEATVQAAREGSAS
ncbi:MFS transporter [Roseateles violae]|uniref:MFS transporter n=1 Tax=Roseateles violae TaxID=3058042 RepID=A0ABT8DT40_9BURK|nr:MFS transporter [Pelomonas sp. PFR6]MDN3921477.1 MFS transporter [Pelomonas sp. PFR6]